MLSARLAKVLDLLITSLTTCLCNAREHVAKSGDIRQRTTITAEIQGNYPNFKRNLAEKKILSFQKSAKARCLANAVLEQRGYKS